MENPLVCKDADHYAVWGYLLHHAAHSEKPALFGGKKITLQPGQLVAGRKIIAAHFGINEHKVYRILNLFKSEQQIELQSSNVNSLISVVNWEKYQASAQSSAQSNEQQVSSECATNEQQVSSECATNEQQVSTLIRTKEDKKERNVSHTQEISSSSFSRVREEISTPAAENSPTTAKPVAAVAHPAPETHGRRAFRILEWIEETYPDIAGMAEPLTPEQAATIGKKLADDDIVRIIEQMHNKGVAERNRSAYSTFTGFMQADHILRERRTAHGKFLTFVEKEAIRTSGKGYTDKHFDTVVKDGVRYWFLKFDKINQQ